MNVEEIFKTNLNKYMQINNCSQLELAGVLNVSNVTIHKWCKGENMPRMNKIDKICQYFCITREQLLTDNYLDLDNEVTEAKDLTRRINALTKYDRETILAMIERFEQKEQKSNE